MSDTIDKALPAAANKPAPKATRKFKRLLRWFKRPKSTNPSASQPNSTRASVPSASGAQDHGPGTYTEGAEPTASGGNGTLHQAPTAPSLSAELSIPYLSGSIVDRGSGGETSHTSTPTAQLALLNPQAQIPDWKANAKEGLGVASRFMQTLLKKVPDCLDGNPVKMAFSIAKVIIDIKDAVGDNNDQLVHRLEETANKLLAVETTVDNGIPEAARQAMETFKQVLGDEMGKLRDLSSKWMATQILDHEDYKNRIQKIFQQVEEATKAFEIKMMISIQNTATGIQNTATGIQNTATGIQNTATSIQDTTTHIQNMTTRIQKTAMSIEQTVALERLRPSYKADYKTVLEEKTLKREECIAGTRVKILEDITKWANDSSSESAHVFWLTGQAGSGKTTIAYTIAKSFEKTDQRTILGANFLCSRQFEETRQRTRIVRTIAYQLARTCKPYADALHAADNFDAANYDVTAQLKSLLIEPWRQSEATHHQQLPPYLVVIDALDEIEDDGGSAFLQDLLKAINEYNLTGFKFLVTSRSHPKIVALCRSFTSEAILRLQDVPIDVGESDIGKYLKIKLPKLADSPELAELRRRTGGLFIYAATVVKHLTRSGSITREEQAKMLSKLLSNSSKSTPANKAIFLIDELYRQIMHDAFSKYDDEEISSHRLRILYTILCTAERTSTSVVAALLVEGDNEDTRTIIRAVVEDLHSVLYIQDDHVFWYHASFPDFIFNPARSNFRVDDAKFEFACNEPAHHNLLGESCFRVMSSSSGLRFNMGDIESSFLFDSDNTDALSKKVNANISAVLRYSSRHWTYHLPSPRSVETGNLLLCILDFLKIRILFWIEAMNLLELSSHCTLMLQYARQWVLKCGNSHLRLASDIGEAANFATYFTGSPAAKSTPHLYISALATWRHDTSLCRSWKQQFAHIPVFTHTKGSTGLPLMTVLTGNTIFAVGFSSDGTRVVSGSGDHSVRVWDASTGAELKVLNGHTGWVNSVAFSNDGTRIVSGSGDHSVRVWDVSTGAELKVLDGHTDVVASVAFSSDGTRIVSSSRDCSVRLWNAWTGAELKVLNGHTEWVNSVAFSSDGTRVVSGSKDHSVRVWNALTGAELKVLNDHTEWVNSVAFSSDGTRIVSGSGDCSVRVWDVSTGAELKVLNGHTSVVSSVAFSNDGTRIVSGSGDHSVRVWDAWTGAELKVLNGHIYTVFSTAFSSDGTRIVSSSEDPFIQIWDASTSAEVEVLSGHTHWVRSVAFSSDGTRIVSGSDDHSVRVWDAWTGAELKVLNGHTTRVNSVAFSGDGGRIMSGSDDDSVWVWDASTGAELKVININNHSESVYSVVAFSSDGMRIVSGWDDDSMQVWDASTGAKLEVLNGHTSIISSVAFSSDSTRIVSGSGDCSVRVWNALTGAELKVLNGHTEWVYSVAFSNDGTQIVSGSSDCSVRVWDASTGDELKVLNGHTSIIFSVAFSNDGTRIVSGSGDHSVRVWDASTGAVLNVFHGHNGTVESVGFSSDDMRIVSGSRDDSVRVWDVSTGAKSNMLGSHTTSVNPVAFSNDDHFSWSLTKNNWLVSVPGQKALMWVPQHAQVAQPSNILTISRNGFGSVDFRQSLLGVEWVGCYTP